MPTSPSVPSRALPASPPPGPARPPWYRRPSLLVVLAIVVVVVVTIVTDLPTHANRSSDIVDARATLTEIASDAQPCNLGMTESLGFYRDVTSGHIAAAHRAQIPALIRDDLNACSYTSQSIDDLASIDMPSSASGRQLNTIATNVLVWCDPDALTAIGAITQLLDQPHDRLALTRLASSEKLLTSDRRAAFANIAKLSRLLGAPLHPGLALVRAP